MSRWAIGLLVAGCYNPTIAPGAPCETEADCPRELACVANVCGGTAQEPDAALPDMRNADAAIDTQTIEMIVLGDQASEVRDADIYDATPTTNAGAANHFSIDSGESGVLWFDLAAIPSDATVTSAMLTVTVADQADEGGGTATIHRLREAWVEAEVTWNQRTAAQAWSVLGARAPASDAVPLASFSPAAIDTSYNIALAPSLIQAWIDTPAVNYGLIFARGTSTEHVHIYTRESANHPKLTVSYY